jgi:hypothetical protein
MSKSNRIIIKLRKMQILVQNMSFPWSLNREIINLWTY